MNVHYVEAQAFHNDSARGICTRANVLKDSWMWRKGLPLHQRVPRQALWCIIVWRVFGRALSLDTFSARSDMRRIVLLSKPETSCGLELTASVWPSPFLWQTVLSPYSERKEHHLPESAFYEHTTPRPSWRTVCAEFLNAEFGVLCGESVSFVTGAWEGTRQLSHTVDLLPLLRSCYLFLKITTMSVRRVVA